MSVHPTPDQNLAGLAKYILSENSYARIGTGATYARCESRHTGPVKVFLVEDSAMLRQRLLAILGSIPGAVSCGHAAGATEAIAAIQAAKPDVVVLDIQLESGNGFDVLRAVGTSTNVYVLTNFANDGYRRKAESLGARGFFDKSSEIDQLRQALIEASA